MHTLPQVRLVALYRLVDGVPRYERLVFTELADSMIDGCIATPLICALASQGPEAAKEVVLQELATQRCPEWGWAWTQWQLQEEAEKRKGTFNEDLAAFKATCGSLIGRG